MPKNSLVWLGGKFCSRLQTVRIGMVVVAALCALLPVAAWAHPLGNFTVNRYTRIEPGAEQITLTYIVDMAEIPALQERQQMDSNGDGMVDTAEQQRYAESLVGSIAAHLSLSINGAPAALIRDQNVISFPEGQGGLPTLRLEARFTAVPPNQANYSVRYHDSNFADRIGWSEVVVRGAGVLDSSAPAQDQSNELRAYPKDLLDAPPSVASAEFSVAPAAAKQTNPQNSSPNSTGYPQMGQSGDSFSALLSAPLANPLALAAVLAAAFALGAAHALAPGHGKTIVAAYLVGSRGTAWHALFLGLTTTVTHTAGVFSLGLVTLFVSRFVLPERLYPWLGVLSGMLVVVLGWGLLRARWQHAHQPRQSLQPHSHQADGWHSHGFGTYHSHAVPAAERRMSMRNLLMLGVSGGLIPCPSALVVLLGSIAVQRVGFGLLLIVMFSIGLASVLTLIGVALVYARRLFERIPTRSPLLRFLPVASACVVILAGAGVTAQALISAFAW